MHCLSGTDLAANYPVKTSYCSFMSKSSIWFTPEGMRKHECNADIHGTRTLKQKRTLAILVVEINLRSVLFQFILIFTQMTWQDCHWWDWVLGESPRTAMAATSALLAPQVANYSPPHLPPPRFLGCKFLQWKTWLSSKITHLDWQVCVAVVHFWGIFTELLQLVHTNTTWTKTKWNETCRFHYFFS